MSKHSYLRDALSINYIAKSWSNKLNTLLFAGIKLAQISGWFSLTSVKMIIWRKFQFYILHNANGSNDVRQFFFHKPFPP